MYAPDRTITPTDACSVHLPLKLNDDVTPAKSSVPTLIIAPDKLFNVTRDESSTTSDPETLMLTNDVMSNRLPDCSRTLENDNHPADSPLVRPLDCTVSVLPPVSTRSLAPTKVPPSTTSTPLIVYGFGIVNIVMSLIVTRDDVSPSS
jgi:hypothetical protein